MPKLLIVAAATMLIGTSAVVAGPLHDAVKNDDLARLQELVEAGEDPNAMDKFVGTALHWAAFKNNIDAARLLIDAGADVKLPKRGGGKQTAMHFAAERGSVDVATLLVEAGADLEALTDEGNRPLHIAAGADQVEVAKQLIEAGADVEARTVRGHLHLPVLHVGEFTPLMKATEINAVGVIELFVAAGADIDAKTPRGLTALYLAATNGRADALRKLIELGADVNGAPETEPVFPTTPLARAIALGLDEIADILRQAGA